MFDWIFKKTKLSDGIEIDRQLISKRGDLARIVESVEDAPMCRTLIVKGDYFDLKVRGPSMFDELFKDWRWVRV